MTAREVQIHSEVFNSVYLPLLEDMTPLQILYGGSSSGKSVFAVGQRPIYDVLHGNRNYLIARQVGRTIRNSVFNEIQKTIINWGLSGLFNVNKSDMVITCANGYQILFSGLDDVEKLKSITPLQGVITDVVVEEATETEYASVKQLEKRLRGGSESIAKRMTLLFNPIMQTSWIYEQYFKNIGWADDQKEYKTDEVHILKTTYKDNLRFLTKQDVARLENEKDKYYYDVYTLGNWGVLGNVIFKNFEIMDLSGMRSDFVNRKCGLDFGFADDPAAASLTHYDRKNKTIYIFDEIYSTGLTNDLLADELKWMLCEKLSAKNNATGQIETLSKFEYQANKEEFDKKYSHIEPLDYQDIIKADSAEPKSIAELINHGLRVSPAVKGKDSVLHGIQWLQQQRIIIDVSCINTQNEFRSYKWKEDQSGKAIPVPVDHNNHIIDGMRYAYEDEMGGGLWGVS